MLLSAVGCSSNSLSLNSAHQLLKGQLMLAAAGTALIEPATD